MAHIGDAIVSFPVSGSSSGSAGIPPSVFFRVSQQALSATNYVVFHPGGAQASALQLAPRNNNRQRFSILNSGTLVLLIDHGSTFNPQGSPTAGIPNYDRQVAANMGVYDEILPTYTGPIFVGWIGSGSVSGSSAVMTEFV